jgi:hypothetical protein
MGLARELGPGSSNYVITLRGRYQGTLAAAETTHNAIVAMVPAPGPQALGNSAHMIYKNPADAGEILIIEVWTNEANQEAAYMELAPALEMLWATGSPTITRWRTTTFTRW